MYFLVSDGGQRSDDHVETIEPGPSLDVVKAQRAEADHEGQRGSEKLEIAGSSHRCIVPSFRRSVPGGMGDPVSRATVRIALPVVECSDDQ